MCVSYWTSPCSPSLFQYIHTISLFCCLMNTDNGTHLQSTRRLINLSFALPGHGKSGHGQNFSCCVCSCRVISAIRESSMVRKVVVFSYKLMTTFCVLNNNKNKGFCNNGWTFSRGCETSCSAHISGSPGLVVVMHRGKPGNLNISTCHIPRWSSHSWHISGGRESGAFLPISDSAPAKETFLHRKYTQHTRYYHNEHYD